MGDISKSVTEETCTKDLNFDEIIALSPETVETRDNVKQITAYERTECEYVDTRQVVFEQHQKSHEPRPPESYVEVIVYVCSLCYGQYKSVEDLRGHMIEFHNCKDAKVEEKKDMVETESEHVVIASWEEPGTDEMEHVVIASWDAPAVAMEADYLPLIDWENLDD